MLYYKFEFIEGLPEDYGIYLFVLESNEIKEGLYDSFSYPYYKEKVRFIDISDNCSYYSKVKGYLILKEEYNTEKLYSYIL